MTLSPNQNYGWIDYLRVFACFLVVVAHSCDAFVANASVSVDDFMAGATWGAFYRPCVPLFAMISGYLLLPVKTDMISFYKTKMKRLLVPFFGWAILMPLLFWGYYATGVQTQNPCITVDEHLFPTPLIKIFTSIFNFSYSTVPMWYLYMLIGLYLFIPIMGVFLAQASKKELKIFLKIWLFSSTIPYIQMIAPYLGYEGNGGNMSLWGVCDWNPYGTFYYFSGFIGYLVLAFYLKKFPLQWTWKKTLSITLPLWAAGYAFTLFGFLKVHELFPGDFSKVEVIWYFCGINVLMMTVPFFVWFEKIKIKSNPIIKKIASVSFGIFLCHFLFVHITYDWLYPLLSSWSPYLKIPLFSIVAFVMSFIFVWLLSLNRWTKRIVE